MLETLVAERMRGINMTEQNREEILKDIREGYIDEWDNMTIDELFETIEKEHEEIQQYRAIGTVEELRALKEKSVAKKPIDISRVRDGDGYIGLVGKCPCCEDIVEEDTLYCDCGQHLDWE